VNVFKDAAARSSKRKGMLRAALIAVIFVAGCVTSQVIRLGSKTDYAAIPVESVQVFVQESDIPGKHEKLALIKLSGDSDLTNETRMIDEAKRAAASIGANGVVLGAINEPSTGAKVAAAVFGVSTTRKGDVLAVRFEASAGAKPLVQTDTIARISSGATEEVVLRDGDKRQFSRLGIVIEYRRGYMDYSKLTFDGCKGVSRDPNGPFSAMSVSIREKDEIFIRTTDDAVWKFVVKKETSSEMNLVASEVVAAVRDSVGE
jgi:hypothetical protein